MNVSEIVGRWYDDHKRYLPWRENKGAYEVWLSEIILQQTRVSQGTPYYHRFLTAFPEVYDLANAELEEVLIHWQGLGYYSRARNLHKAAQQIVNEFGGVFPSEYADLRKLPGIGDYSASAIASLVYNEPHAAVDGNVYRVLSRYFGIDTPIDSTRGKKEFKALAQEILDTNDPGRHNQAMIELGALVCLPKNPQCGSCPLMDSCNGYKHRSYTKLPVKSKKQKLSDRYFYYLHIKIDDEMYIRKRGEKDIWAGLFDLPLIELSESVGLDKLMISGAWRDIFNDGMLEINSFSEEYIHILSHQRLRTRFVQIEIREDIKYRGAIKINGSDLVSYPFPQLLLNYFRESGLSD